MNVLKAHSESLKKFREKHIIQEEETKGKEGNEEEEEEREYDDLIGIEENSSEETKVLPYNCRKLCKKYYRDKEFIKIIDDNRGADPDTVLRQKVNGL